MERTKKVVVDASIVAKWYVKEELSDKALELRDDFKARRLDLISPSLLLYEVANGLRYSPELSSEDILDAVESLVGMQLSLVDFDAMKWRDTVKNALRFRISVYDSAYFTTAEMYALKVVTADRRLYNKVRGKHSILLADYDHDVI